MRNLVLAPAKEAVRDGVSPFKDAGKSDQEVVWAGPWKIGPFSFALHGPLQLVFIVLAVLTVVALAIEYRRDGFDWVRTISGVLFFLVCLYLVYLGKAIYVLKAFRKEVTEFKRLNRQMRKEVTKLEGQNEEYEAQNREHERLNQELSEQVGGLAHVEEKLSSMSAECNGSIQEARDLLSRLDRFMRLDTVNTVFQFFDRSDRDRNGKVDGNEVSMFVDNLGFLWRHLPHFDAAKIKAEIAHQGGMSLEQVHKLVDVMLLDEAGKDGRTMSKKLELVFAEDNGQEVDLEGGQGNPQACSTAGSHPGAVDS